MQKIPLLLISVLLILSATSCKKKCYEIGSFTFNSNELKIIPYFGRDTLKIINDGNGLTDTLRGIRSDEFNTITENSHSGIDDQACKGDYYMVQYTRINFASINTLAISLDLEFDNPFTSNGIKKYLNITIGTTYDPTVLFYHRIPIKNDSIEINDSTVLYHANLSVGSRQYSFVYEFFLEIPSSAEIQRVYYTLSRGIVAYLREGTIFYVDEI